MSKHCIVSRVCVAVTAASLFVMPAFAQECLLDTNNNGTADPTDTDGGANSFGSGNLVCGTGATTGISGSTSGTVIGANARLDNAPSETSATLQFPANRGTAVGASSTARGPNSTAIGANATGFSGAVALGYAATAQRTGTALGAETVAGEGAVAIGRRANAVGGNIDQGSTAFGAVAIGNIASAQGARAVALGTVANASGNQATALGNNTTASAVGATVVGGFSSGYGEFSTALGYSVLAQGFRATASGYRSRAVGDQSTVVGNDAQATGIAASTFGGYALAQGDFSSAIGYSSYAAAPQATALGNASRALHAGSTAVGAGATTTAANQVKIGAAGSSVQVGDIVASTTAQQGPVYLVTTDASGTLGRQAAQAGQAFFAQAVSDAQFDALSARTDQLGARLDGVDVRLRQANGGIAAAMAMAGTAILPDKALTASFNLATYRGEQGFSGAVAAAVSRDFYVTGAITGSTVKGSTAGRVGVVFGL